MINVKSFVGMILMLFRLPVLACLALACPLWAQSLEVTRSPASPTTEYLESGTAFDAPLAAFRLAASGGDVDVDAVSLALAGSGDFTSDVSELAAWLDDGDGTFDDGLDQLLWSGPAATSSVTASFASPVTVSSGITEDIWIVASFEPGAGSSLGKSYEVSIADSADVSTTPAASATLGTPSPQSVPLTLIEFFVTDRGSIDCQFGARSLELTGSGFTPPVQMYIDGMPMGGTVQVNDMHTKLWWHFGGADAPDGQVLQIHTASLGLKNVVGGWAANPCEGGGRSGPDDDGCTTQVSRSPRLAVLLSTLLLLFAGRAILQRKSLPGRP